MTHAAPLPQNPARSTGDAAFPSRVHRLRPCAPALRRGVDARSAPSVLPPRGWRGLWRRGLYAFTAHVLLEPLFRAFWGLRVSGMDRVPSRGPVLLAANHASFIDPLLAAAACRRPIFFMGKAELFRFPVFGWLLRQLNAFPVRRKAGDRSALRTALRVLSAGGLLIVFPEGRRQPAGRFAKPLPGVTFLAAASGAPVVPVYLHNTHRFPARVRLEVAAGAPLTPAPREMPSEFAERVMRALEGLREQIQRRPTRADSEPRT